MLASWPMMYGLAILLGIVAAAYMYLTRNFDYWRRKGVAFVEPIPLFGNFYRVITQRQPVAEFFYDVYNRTTDKYIGFYIFNKPCLYVRDPELIKAILVRDFNVFSERSVACNSKHDELGTNNLFSIKNPLWKQMRTKLTPIFSSGRMKMMCPLMSDVGRRLNGHVGRIVDGDSPTTGVPPEMKEICSKYSTDVIATIAYGIQANCLSDEDAEFRKVGRRMFNFNFRRSLEFMSFFFAPTLVKLFGFYFFEPSCTPFLRNVFWETLRSRERTGVTRPDLIDTLIKLKNDDDAERPENITNGHGPNAAVGVNATTEIRNGEKKELKFKGDTLAAQSAVFFTAGFETAGTTMSFTLYELCLNLKLQDRVRAEIRSVVANHNGEINYESLAEMKLLHQCVQETLRLYPTLPFVDRVAQRDYQLPGTDLVVEKGTSVYIGMFGLHRDPKYFPNPFTYDPDRFSDENKQNIPYCTFIPFGEGPHNCIGERFGYMQTKIGLAHILIDFEVHRTAKTPVPIVLNPKALLVNPIGGLYMDFKKVPNAKT